MKQSASIEQRGWWVGRALGLSHGRGGPGLKQYGDGLELDSKKTSKSLQMVCGGT